MKKSKVIVGLVALLMVLVIPIKVLAASIQTSTVSYSNLSSLKSVESSALAFDYDNMRYISSWSSVATDVDSGYYTKITTKKKATILYNNKDILTINTPNASSTVTRTVNGIGKGTYKFEIYNQYMKSTGKVNVNFSSEKYE